MQLSPLILKNYFVTNLSVKACVPNFRTAEEVRKAFEEGTSNMSAKVETAKNDANPRLWKVALVLALGPNEKGHFCPYLIDVELVGFFEVHVSVEESKIQDLVVCNGPSILASAARELILLITGRGPLPPFTLPSVTFVDHCQAQMKGTPASAAK